MNMTETNRSFDKVRGRQGIAWLGARMREPSTWAGIAAVAVTLHIGIPPDLWSAVTQIGVGIGGAIAFFLPESKAT
jgi:hypothetical protein